MSRRFKIQAAETSKYDGDYLANNFRAYAKTPIFF